MEGIERKWYPLVRREQPISWRHLRRWAHAQDISTLQQILSFLENQTLAWPVLHITQVDKLWLFLRRVLEIVAIYKRKQRRKTFLLCDVATPVPKTCWDLSAGYWREIAKQLGKNLYCFGKSTCYVRQHPTEQWFGVEYRRVCPEGAMNDFCFFTKSKKPASPPYVGPFRITWKDFQQLYPLIWCDCKWTFTSFSEAMRNICCSAWYKQDIYGEPFVGHWKHEDEAKRENAWDLSLRDSIQAMWKLPFTRCMLLWSIEYICGCHPESVWDSFILCTLVYNKMLTFPPLREEIARCIANHLCYDVAGIVVTYLV